MRLNRVYLHPQPHAAISHDDSDEVNVNELRLTCPVRRRYESWCPRFETEASDVSFAWSLEITNDQQAWSPPMPHLRKKLCNRQGSDSDSGVRFEAFGAHDVISDADVGVWNVSPNHSV